MTMGIVLVACCMARMAAGVANTMTFNSQSHELGRKITESLVLSLSKAPFDDEILILDIPKFAHALEKADVQGRY